MKLNTAFSPSTFSNIGNGRRMPSVATALLVTLCIVLSATTAAFAVLWVKENNNAAKYASELRTAQQTLSQQQQQLNNALSTQVPELPQSDKNDTENVHISSTEATVETSIPTPAICITSVNEDDQKDAMQQLIEHDVESTLSSNVDDDKDDELSDYPSQSEEDQTFKVDNIDLADQALVKDLINIFGQHDLFNNSDNSDDDDAMNIQEFFHMLNDPEVSDTYAEQPIPKPLVEVENDADEKEPIAKPLFQDDVDEHEAPPFVDDNIDIDVSASDTGRFDMGVGMNLAVEPSPVLVSPQKKKLPVNTNPAIRTQLLKSGRYKTAKQPSSQAKLFNNNPTRTKSFGKGGKIMNVQQSRKVPGKR